MADAVALVLPWSCLVPTNQRTNPAGWGRMKGRQFLTKRYRSALDEARIRVLDQVRGPRPRFPTGPVAVELRFWLPDRRRRDPANLTKLVHDALEPTVYADDVQIEEHHWYRSGIDRDGARVEILVTPLAPEEAS